MIAQHVDILDQPDRLGSSFLGSLGFHVLLILALLFYGVLFRHKVEQWGSPTGGGMGAVVVNPVARIPLPARQSPANTSRWAWASRPRCTYPCPWIPMTGRSMGCSARRGCGCWCQKPEAFLHPSFKMLDPSA